LSNEVAQENRPITFMFPGMGDQYVNAAAQLYDSEPVFRRHVTRCCELLRPHLELDLQQVLYPKGDGRRAGAVTPSPGLRQMLGRATQGNSAGRIERTSLAHSILFAIEYALARLWMS
jgi:acyl transferase domain-containing protein